MHEKAEVFETHYQDYCRGIGQSDLKAAAEILGIQPEGDGVRIRFLNETYHVSGEGIRDESGGRPAYGLCVILAKYILCCPDRIYHDPQWVAFRDFKKDAAITNVNYFTSDVEKAIIGHFQGHPDRLEEPVDTWEGFPMSPRPAMMFPWLLIFFPGSVFWCFSMTRMRIFRPCAGYYSRTTRNSTWIRNPWP